MYVKIIIILLNIVLVNSDCDKDVCVSDFLKEFFKNSESIVFSDKNGSTVEENIEIVDLDTILKEISNILTRETNETELLKNYDNQTYVYVQTFDLNRDKKVENKADKRIRTDSSVDIKFNFTKTETLDKTFEELFKKAVEEDNEILDENLDNLYVDVNDDNSTDYLDIDYIEIYKDTPVEEFLYVPTEPSIDNVVKKTDDENEVVQILFEFEENDNITESTIGYTKPEVEPFIHWITTIFVVNQTNNFQFDYLCDGILITENTILTGARCVHRNIKTIDPEDLLVVLGKKSLQTTADSEKITKIRRIITHENFTNENGNVLNDLAILVMEEPIVENEDIKMANISDVEDFHKEINETATTGWSLFGEITPIYFVKDENSMCAHMNKVENTICATYGNDVALCPSYGGLYAAKIEEKWYLQGIFYGDPKDRGICFNKSVLYTSLENYLIWITDIITRY